VKASVANIGVQSKVHSVNIESTISAASATLNIIANSTVKLHGQAQAYQDATITRLSGHSAVLQAVNHTLDDTRDIFTTHQAESLSNHQETHQAVKDVGLKIDELKNMSTGQFNNILQLLQQISAGQTAAKPSEPPSRIYSLECDTAMEDRKESSARTVLESERIAELEDDLSGSIDRLGHLAKDKPRTVFSTEAQNIIDDLEIILDNLSRVGRQGEDGMNSGKRKPEDLRSVARDLQRMKGMLIASPVIGLNGP
jgi:hypothetical protein